MATFSQDFAQRWADGLNAAVPLGAHWATRLAAVGETLHERPVLETVYATADAPARFVSFDGLTPAGVRLQQELTLADRHALKPKDYHVSELPGLLDTLEQAVAAAPAAPPAPSGEELVPLRRVVEALGGELGRQEAGPALMARLLGPNSPVPRLHEQFELARAERTRQAVAAAHLELVLADGLAHYARHLGRGNTARATYLARNRAKLDLPLEDDPTGPRDPSDDGGEVEVSPEATPRADAAGAVDAAPPKPEPSPAVAAEEGGEAAEREVEAPLVLRDAEAYVRARLQADLRGVGDLASLEGLLAELPPAHPQYGRLLDALQRYRAFAAAGGFTRVRRNRKLRPGRSHKQVVALKRRLSEEGFYAAGEEPLTERYDDALSEAVRRYQETHQMEVSGRPHRMFWSSLAVTAERRVQAIEITLQRWRESAVGAAPYYVLVNVPGFHVEVWRDGEQLLRHRIVAGKAGKKRCDEATKTRVLAHATPMQSALMEFLVFAPHWNVTRRIKETELDPERGKDPLYYQRHGYEVMRAGSAREWVRELPGPANSLGFVKFIFPNSYATFLHDTPLKKLFDRPVRAYSHGCMRVQDPWGLAKLLLEQDGQWDERRYRRLLTRWKSMNFTGLRKSWDPERYESLKEAASGLERTVHLRSPVPIHVEYFTVRVDEHGRVHFLSDIYRYDEQRLNPKPAKRCVPESKAARRSFTRVPAEVDELERQAVALVPRVLQAQSLGGRLRPKGPWKERHALKQLAKLERFAEHHRNLARRIREEHARLNAVLEENGGRWRRSVVREAVSIHRLLAALRSMGRHAKATCAMVEKLAGAKPPPPAPAPPAGGPPPTPPPPAPGSVTP